MLIICLGFAPFSPHLGTLVLDRWGRQRGRAGRPFNQDSALQRYENRISKCQYVLKGQIDTCFLFCSFDSSWEAARAPPPPPSPTSMPKILPTTTNCWGASTYHLPCGDPCPCEFKGRLVDQLPCVDDHPTNHCDRLTTGQRKHLQDWQIGKAFTPGSKDYCQTDKKNYFNTIYVFVHRPMQHFQDWGEIILIVWIYQSLSLCKGISANVEILFVVFKNPT